MHLYSPRNSTNAFLLLDLLRGFIHGFNYTPCLIGDVHSHWQCTPHFIAPGLFISVFFGALNRGGSRNLRKGVHPLPSLSLPLSLFFPLPLPFSSLPLKVGPLKLAMGQGSAVSSPSGVRGGAPAEKKLVHSKAVRKPLVAVILNILSIPP